MEIGRFYCVWKSLNLTWDCLETTDTSIISVMLGISIAYIYSTFMLECVFHLLTPWSRVLLEKLTGFQLVKKSPAFYGTRRFITTLTSACHLSLSWASLIQSIPPHPTSWRSILILSFNLCLWLLSGLFPSGFPTSRLPHTCYMPRPAHSSHFMTWAILGEEYRSLSSLLCIFLHSPLTSSLLGPNILLKHPQSAFLPHSGWSSFTPSI